MKPTPVTRRAQHPGIRVPLLAALWLWGAVILAAESALEDPAAADTAAADSATADEGPATAYYRWIDSAGRIQYTDFEPIGVPSQRIPLNQPADDDAPAISRAAEDRQPDPFHDQDGQILPIEHIGPCADARRQLSVLHAAVPVYRDEDGHYRAAWRGDTYRGERRWLDADGRNAAIVRARSAVLGACSDPAAFDREVRAFESEVGKH